MPCFKFLLFGWILTSPLIAAPIQRIAFGSCLNQTRSMQIFSTMARLKPQITIFMGDNIYADGNDMAKKNRAYQKLFRNQHFQNLRLGSRLLATWDDHDYGYNDIGASYASKRKSRKMFLRYFRQGKTPGHDGIYESYVFGKAQRRVQVILLDTRYFKSPWPTVNSLGQMKTDTRSTMLGQKQWQWLEAQLKVSARLRLIVSSIQFLAINERGEGWYLFKHEQERMLNLLKKTRAKGVVFLSGDRHYAEVSRLAKVLPYDLYEFTSSSFNQVWHDGALDKNLRRDGKSYAVANFGFLRIDWRGTNALLTFEFRDALNNVLTHRFINLAQLE